MDSVSGKTFPTIDPATGKKIADIAEGDKVGGCIIRNIKGNARTSLQIGHFVPIIVETCM